MPSTIPETVDKFIVWICHKFGIGESKELVRDFEKETYSFIDPVKQLKYEELEKEDYIDTIVYTVGSYTYILSENNIFIGRTKTKKSFMCNFGIC